jgi:hypothetical protein
MPSAARARATAFSRSPLPNRVLASDQADCALANAALVSSSNCLSMPSGSLRICPRSSIRPPMPARSPGRLPEMRAQSALSPETCFSLAAAESFASASAAAGTSLTAAMASA